MRNSCRASVTGDTMPRILHDWTRKGRMLALARMIVSVSSQRHFCGIIVMVQGTLAHVASRELNYRGGQSGGVLLQV
jgi:hypothetical protein